MITLTFNYHLENRFIKVILLILRTVLAVQYFAFQYGIYKYCM